MKCIFLVLIVWVLTACGGGGGDSSSPQSQTPSSSLLSENQAPSNARFHQYHNHSFEIQPDTFGFAGDMLFLKVYLSSGSVLFLGQIDKHATLTLPLSLPVGEKVVKFDLFSDFEGDKNISGEVAL